MHDGPREVAIRLLARTDDSFRASCLAELGDPRDRALAVELSNGTVKWKGLIDRQLSLFSSRPLRRLPKALLEVLRIGAFQLLFTSIPQYAAVSATVGLLERRSDRAYANGLLRSLARSAGHVGMPSLDRDPVRYASARYSYPSWIPALFVRRFGLRWALALCDAGNRAPPLTLRVNSLRISRDRFLSVLREAGHAVEPGLAETSVRLQGGADLRGLPGFSEGSFVVQDEGAIAVGEAVGARPGERVWDMCAAPGGKTAHLAETMLGRGEVLATDVDETRALMIRETLGRLGFDNVSVEVRDATRPPDRVFDRILLDAPCSGLGVLRRNPDLRWNRRPGDIENMVRRQALLLESAAKCLARGGTLVYSTCTLTEEENEGVFSAFLRDHPGFEPDAPDCAGGAGLGRETWPYAGPPFSGPGYRYILPHFSGTDGFFVARARKTG